MSRVLKMWKILTIFSRNAQRWLQSCIWLYLHTRLRVGLMRWRTCMRLDALQVIFRRVIFVEFISVADFQSRSLQQLELLIRHRFLFRAVRKWQSRCTAHMRAAFGLCFRSQLCVQIVLLTTRATRRISLLTTWIRWTGLCNLIEIKNSVQQ